ncbi:MAG TPA: ATP-binding protein [Candidatus Acidoferrum sp.]|jgi:heavy metal sensor kinase
MTLLYFGVLAVTFVAFFWICDIGFRNSIETTVNASSRTNLETIERLIANTAPKGTEALSTELCDLANLWASGALFEVADANGKWLFRSEAFLQQHPAITIAPTSRVDFVTTNLNANQYRVALVRAQLDGRAYEIHAAVPTEPFDQALDRFRLIEQETLPALVLLASILGYWLSGRSLAPVRAIIRTAEQIGVDNLSRRLEVPKPRDELRRLTETLNAMLERIENSFRRITQFTADASHDLRTPVAVIRASAEIVLRKPRSAAEYEDTLQRILRTSVETSGMLENLLSLARADAGAAGLEMHPLDLSAHVRKAQEKGAILAATKSLSFTSQVPEAKVLVRADALAIDRLLLILVDNAVKYTPPGGVCEIALSAAENEVHIAVRDSGVGIETEELESIFERFHRSDKTRSRETPGAGLGLAIARWIAKVHGGTITAESKIGFGSVFHVRLPALAVG